MTSLDLTPDELLTTTRSVRKRLDLERPVPLELVRECLDIALQAPSGSNRQQWHWVVVTDEGQRAAIGDLYRRAVESYLDSPGSAARLFAEDPERAAVQSRVGDSVAYLGERMGQVPVLVIPCLRVSRLPGGSPSIRLRTPVTTASRRAATLRMGSPSDMKTRKRSERTVWRQTTSSGRSSPVTASDFSTPANSFTAPS